MAGVAQEVNERGLCEVGLGRDGNLIVSPRIIGISEFFPLKRFAVIWGAVFIY